MNKAKSINVVQATGGSMAPFIPPGCYLHIERISPDDIGIGDVVCYIDADARGVAHRVTRKQITERGTVLYVQGDAQSIEEAVPAEAIISVVRRVEHRLFFYDTNGFIGQVIKRIALGQDRKTRIIRSILRFARRIRLMMKQKH